MGHKQKYGLFQIILLALNGFLMVAGLVVVGVGAYLYVDRANLLGAVFDLPIVVTSVGFIIAAGILVFFVAFIGFCAIGMHNVACIVIYISLMSLVVIGAFVSVALAIVVRAIHVEQVREEMKRDIRERYGVGLNISYNAFITNMWDQTQLKWYCCAADQYGWGIYQSSAWYEIQEGDKESDRDLVPISCCIRNQYGDIIDKIKCQKFRAGPPYTASGENEALHSRGCYDVGKEVLYDTSAGLIGLGIILAVLAIGAVILALLICIQTRHQK